MNCKSCGQEIENRSDARGTPRLVGVERRRREQALMENEMLRQNLELMKAELGNERRRAERDRCRMAEIEAKLEAELTGQRARIWGLEANLEAAKETNRKLILQLNEFEPQF